MKLSSKRREKVKVEETEVPQKRHRKSDQEINYKKIIRQEGERERKRDEERKRGRDNEDETERNKLVRRVWGVRKGRM